MFIRKLQKTDFTKGFKETLENLRSLGEMTNVEFEKIFNTITQNPNHTVFIAEDNEKVIGTVTLLIEQKFIRNGGRVGHIEDVSVQKDFQGQGIGSKLIAQSLEEARAHNCYKVILNCTKENIPFYEKIGFKQNELEMRIDL